MNYKSSSSALAIVMVASSVIPASASTNEVIAGNDRFDTAARIADRMGNYNTAVLVNGYSLADGLSASSLAKYKNAPILLVRKDSIPNSTKYRLNNVNKVYIIGGTGAISSSVENQLRDMGISIERIGGTNRTDTSLKVADKLGNYNKAFIVNGYRGEADAMSVAPVAARDKAPIIITNGRTAPVAQYSGVDYYAIGGSAVVSNGLANTYNATRLAGSNRYETNKRVLNKFYPNTNKLYVANGETLVDALAVSTIASNDGVALTNRRSNKNYLNGKDLVKVGGNVWMPSENEQKPNNKPGEDTNKPGEGETVNPNPSSKASLTAARTTVTITEGTPFNESMFGFKAYDKNGRDVSNQVKVNGHLSIYDPGTYNLVAVSGTGSDAISMGVKLIVTPLQRYDIDSEAYRTQVKAQFYKRLEAERRNAGADFKAHKWQVEEYARLKSQDMARNGYIDHTVIEAPHFSAGAECVAKLVTVNNSTTPEDLGDRIFNIWWNSEDHKAILIHKSLGSDTYIDGMDYCVKGSDVYATYESGSIQDIRP